MDRQDWEQIEKTFTFMDNLEEKDAALLRENVAVVDYARGENVYSAQNDCIGVLLVKSGELRTYILSEDGRDITLYRLGPGEVCILSASCLLKNITFDVYIDAEEDSQVYLTSAVVFAQLQERNVYVENFALKTAVEKFSHVMWAMEQILFTRFDQRLATFLLEEREKTGSGDIRLTHEQMARYVGSAREVVSRMLKHFEKAGMIRLYRGGVEIVDAAQLEKLVE